jgi:hypothetical protein
MEGGGSMSESTNKLKELALLLQDPNCDVNVVTSHIADLLDALPKLLVVVEAAKRLEENPESGYRLWDLRQALVALEEEV